MKKILIIAGALVLCMALAFASGCSQTKEPVATPVQTPEPTVVTTTIATPEPTVASLTPGPTQSLPDMWSMDVQVEGNGEAINPQIIATVRGGKGMNLVQAITIKVTRADGKVEEAQIPRQAGGFRVGDTVSLPITSEMGNVNRVEVWVTNPQGEKVKTFDDYVPFRAY